MENERVSMLPEPSTYPPMPRCCQPKDKNMINVKGGLVIELNADGDPHEAIGRFLKAVADRQGVIIQSIKVEWLDTLAGFRIAGLSVGSEWKPRKEVPAEK